MHVSTDQATVLQAVITRLIAQIDLLNEWNCVIPEDDDEPELPRQSNVIVHVSPMGGTFDDEWFVGGAEHQCHEHTGVVVTVWSQIKLDASQRKTHALLEANRGLMPWKLRILKALTGHRLLDSDGNELLTELLAPRNSQFPRRTHDGKCVGVSISFSIDFLWDLT